MCNDPACPQFTPSFTIGGNNSSAPSFGGNYTFPNAAAANGATFTGTWQTITIGGPEVCCICDPALTSGQQHSDPRKCVANLAARLRQLETGVKP